MSEFFKTADGHVVIGQRPNLPVKLAAGLGAMALVTRGDVRRLAAKGACLSFVVWGALELVCGANGFRKTLGTAAILLSGAALARGVLRSDFMLQPSRTVPSSKGTCE